MYPKLAWKLSSCTLKVFRKCSLANTLLNHNITSLFPFFKKLMVQNWLWSDTEALWPTCKAFYSWLRPFMPVFLTLSVPVQQTLMTHPLWTSVHDWKGPCVRNLLQSLLFPPCSLLNYTCPSISIPNTASSMMYRCTIHLLQKALINTRHWSLFQESLSWK